MERHHSLLDAGTRQPYRYITEQSDLDALVKRIKSARRRIPLDIEANSLYQYFQKVCLIQLTLNEDDYIVDPLVGLDLSEFLEGLSKKPLILHGADYDLRMMRSSLGFIPQAEVFDTMSAAQLLGIEQIGLAALAERFLGVTLGKRNQKSDWSHRPLSEKQLAYAVDDTHYLEPIAQRLEDELKRLGRLEWLKEIGANTVAAASNGMAFPHEKDEPRVKGAALLEPRELAYVHEIWRWRDRLARNANRPPFKIFADQQIVDLATWAAKHPDLPVEKWPRLPRSFNGRRLDGLKRAIRTAREMPPSEWPNPRKRRTAGPPQPDCRREIEGLQAECRRLAEELGIAPAVLAPRAVLAAVARFRPHSIKEAMEAGPMLRWQATLLMPCIEKVLTAKQR